jgi:hypothetical protein
MKPEWNPETSTFKPNLKLAEGTNLGAVTYAFRLEVLIGTGAFKGESAPAVFDRMLSEVERIVSAIEAETSRLMGQLAGLSQIRRHKKAATSRILLPRSWASY